MLIKEGKSLQEYINEIINPSWKQRDFVDSVKMYWKSNMECVLGLSGLRGLGKTIGLLQSLPDTGDALYICAQRRGDEFLDSADSILNVIEKYSKSCKNIIIDEYTWISDREKLDSSLFFYIQNGYRIAITGTESMTLELLNHGALAHRVFMLHCNYFSYEEYLKLNDIEDPDEKTLDNYLRTGGIFKEYAIDNFDSMKSYIKDGIIDGLVLYLKNIPVEKGQTVYLVIGGFGTQISEFYASVNKDEAKKKFKELYHRFGNGGPLDDDYFTDGKSYENFPYTFDGCIIECVCD